MSRSLIVLSALAALAFAGCTSIQRTRAFNNCSVDACETPLEALEIETSGWFILENLPLASGDPRYPDLCTCCAFKDNVTLESNMKMLNREMARVGTDRFVNLSSRWEDESVFGILLSRRACHTSVILLKPVQKDPKSAK